MQKRIFLLVFLICTTSLIAQENLKLAFYNVLNYPSAPPSNRLQILSGILSEMQPDLLMICELESQNGGTDILNNSLRTFNANFEAAPYVNNTSSGADLQQLIYYNNQKFELVDTGIIQTTVRDINRYTLKLQTEEDIFLEVFVTHLKSSQGAANELLREEMVIAFTDYLETIDPNTSVVFAGDLNLYTSEELAYQELLDPTNNIILQDPIETPGDWNNNASFAEVHTQSTRISNNEFENFGAGGGVDSRFDFIMLSKNLVGEENIISYVPDSYAAYGNNGNCFNGRIDSNECGGIFGSDTRSLLYQMSDHLPVVLDLSLDATFLSTDSFDTNLASWALEYSLVVDRVHIAFAKAGSSSFPTTITIIDQTGRVVRRISPSRTESAEILVDFLANGIYFIKSDSSNLPILKFIKTS